MQDPAREIAFVVSSITSSPTPDIQREAVTKYFTDDAGFRNPFFFIKPGPLSREDVLGVYQWYRVLSPNVEPVKVENVIHDQIQDTLVLDIQHSFHIRLSPLKPVPARLLTRLKLSKKDGLCYICYQEDFFHPDEIFNLLVPPVVPVIRFFLSTTSVLSTVFAKSAQVLGFWRTDTSGIEDFFPEQISSVSVDSEGSFVKHAQHNANQIEDEIQKVNPGKHVGLAQKEDRNQKEDNTRGVSKRTQKLGQKEDLARKEQISKTSSQRVHLGSSSHGKAAQL